MGQKLKNISSVFSDPKARGVVVVLFVLGIVALTISYLQLKRSRSTTKGPAAIASVGGTPQTIHATPGVGEPPREYIRLQEQQNVDLAQKALKAGTAAIPTPTRPTYIDTGFTLGDETKKIGCSVEELKAAKGAGISAFSLRCRGCDVAQLKAAGFSAKDLAAAGFSAKELRNAGFTLAELKEAGFSAQNLKDAGFSAKELLNAGFKPGDLHNAGFSAKELLEAGSSPEDLRNAGFSAKDLLEAGVKLNDLKKLGYKLADLQAAGLTPQILTQAGFTTKELLDAGFSPQQLLTAGHSPQQLKEAGVTDLDLIKAGVKKDVIARLPKTTRSDTASSEENISTGTNLNAVARNVQPNLSAASKQKLEMVTSSSMPSEQQAIQDQLTAKRQEQAAQLSKQDFQDKMKQIQQNMMTQTTDLISSWIPIPTQLYTQADAEQVALTEKGTSGTGSNNRETNKAALQNADIYKAGTIMFAVLDTGVNTDEQSPVMATIVHGKLKGAKLIGSFQRVEKKALLQFNIVNVPQATTSLPINVVAIDQNTARVAMATHVDSHYLLRFGTLFASSFLSGLGQAIQTSGSTVTTSSNGQQNQSYANLNVKEKQLVALGYTAQQFGNVLSPMFTMPPTVEVAAGTGIGILFMGDFSIPKTKQ